MKMSINDADEDTRPYVVLVNHEEQYSLWLAEKKEIPNGWKVAREAGTKADCLQWVNEVWTDMTPLSLRKKPSPVDE
jgi:MbtH protein